MDVLRQNNPFLSSLLAIFSQDSFGDRDNFGYQGVVQIIRHLEIAEQYLSRDSACKYCQDLHQKLLSLIEKRKADVRSGKVKLNIIVKSIEDYLSKIEILDADLYSRLFSADKYVSILNIDIESDDTLTILEDNIHILNKELENIKIFYSQADQINTFKNDIQNSLSQIKLLHPAAYTKLSNDDMISIPEISYTGEVEWAILGEIKWTILGSHIILLKDRLLSLKRIQSEYCEKVKTDKRKLNDSIRQEEIRKQEEVRRQEELRRQREEKRKIETEKKGSLARKIGVAALIFWGLFSGIGAIQHSITEKDNQEKQAKQQEKQAELLWSANMEKSLQTFLESWNKINTRYEELENKIEKCRTPGRSTISYGMEEKRNQLIDEQNKVREKGSSLYQGLSADQKYYVSRHYRRAFY